MLGTIGARVAEAELALGHSEERFGPDGSLTDDAVRAELSEVLDVLVAEARPVVAQAA